MSVGLPISVVVWFAWIVFYLLFVCAQLYILHKISRCIYKNLGRHDLDYQMTFMLGFVGMTFLNVFLFACSCTLYEVGIERQQDYILYKKSSALGCVYAHGIKDTKNNRDIQQYKDGEFDILLKEVFKGYDMNTNKYFKITVGDE